MARIYREHPDSSYLLAPRIFTRVFCGPGQLIETVRFYQQLTQERLDMDMDIPEAGLHVVAVGSFLILELDTEEHGLAAQTTVTVLNVDLDQAVARQVAAGAEIVQERWEAVDSAKPWAPEKSAVNSATPEGPSSSVRSAPSVSAPACPPSPPRSASELSPAGDSPLQRDAINHARTHR